MVRSAYSVIGGGGITSQAVLAYQVPGTYLRNGLEQDRKRTPPRTGCKSVTGLPLTFSS